MKIIRTDSRGFAKVRIQLLSRGVTYGKSIESAVQRIINDVRVNGDKALIKYTKKFDRIALSPSTSLRAGLILSLRERKIPSPSRGGTGWGWVNKGILSEANTNK